MMGRAKKTALEYDFFNSISSSKKKEVVDVSVDLKEGKITVWMRYFRTEKMILSQNISYKCITPPHKFVSVQTWAQHAIGAFCFHIFAISVSVAKSIFHRTPRDSAT